MERGSAGFGGCCGGGEYLRGSTCTRYTYIYIYDVMYIFTIYYNKIHPPPPKKDDDI